MEYGESNKWRVIQELRRKYGNERVNNALLQYDTVYSLQEDNTDFLFNMMLYGIMRVSFYYDIDILKSAFGEHLINKSNFLERYAYNAPQFWADMYRYDLECLVSSPSEKTLLEYRKSSPNSFFMTQSLSLLNYTVSSFRCDVDDISMRMTPEDAVVTVWNNGMSYMLNIMFNRYMQGVKCRGISANAKNADPNLLIKLQEVFYVLSGYSIPFIEVMPIVYYKSSFEKVNYFNAYTYWSNWREELDRLDTFQKANKFYMPFEYNADDAADGCDFYAFAMCVDEVVHHYGIGDTERLRCYLLSKLMTAFTERVRRSNEYKSECIMNVCKYVMPMCIKVVERALNTENVFPMMYGVSGYRQMLNFVCSDIMPYYNIFVEELAKKIDLYPPNSFVIDRDTYNTL